MMHKDTAKGMAKEAAGKAKKITGDVTDNPEMEAKGAALEGEGKVQKSFGKVKEGVRDILKH